MKTPQQRLSQLKRIMKALQKRGQNNESINLEYKKLWNFINNNSK